MHDAVLTVLVCILEDMSDLDALKAWLSTYGGVCCWRSLKYLPSTAGCLSVKVAWELGLFIQGVVARAGAVKDKRHDRAALFVT